MVVCAEHGLLAVVAGPAGQYARAPQAHERELLSGFVHISQVPPEPAPLLEALRVTLFSLRHAWSDALLREVMAVASDHLAYYTHFALSALAGFRDSRAQVVDVQPQCQGKAEALRILQTRCGIAPARVVAVGDAGNDLPLLGAVGLGVAMGNATPEVKRAAKRVIGTNQTAALAELIEALFC